MEILRETRIQSDKKVLIIGSVRTSQQDTSYCCHDAADAAEIICSSPDLDKMMTTLRGRVMLASGSGPGCSYKGQCFLDDAVAAAASDLREDDNHDDHDYQLGRPGSFASSSPAHSPHRFNSTEWLLWALSNSLSCCHDVAMPCHASTLHHYFYHHHNNNNNNKNNNKYSHPLSGVNQVRSHSLKRLQMPTVIRTTNTATRRRKWQRSF